MTGGRGAKCISASAKDASQYWSLLSVKFQVLKYAYVFPPLFPPVFLPVFPLVFPPVFPPIFPLLFLPVFPPLQKMLHNTGHF